MRGRLEPKDTVERFWGLKFIGFPNLSDETPKPSRNPAECDKAIFWTYLKEQYSLYLMQK